MMESLARYAGRWRVEENGLKLLITSSPPNATLVRGSSLIRFSCISSDLVKISLNRCYPLFITWERVNREGLKFTLEETG